MSSPEEDTIPNQKAAAAATSPVPTESASPEAKKRASSPLAPDETPERKKTTAAVLSPVRLTASTTKEEKKEELLDTSLEENKDEDSAIDEDDASTVVEELANTKRLFTVAHEKWEEDCKNRLKRTVAFLSCTRYEQSHLKVLAGHSGILRSIAEFTPKPDEPDENEMRFHCQVRARLCSGPFGVHGQTVWVERLSDFDDAGSLSNLLAGSVLRKDWHNVWMSQTMVQTFTNEDGSFWNEAQLRVHLKGFLDDRGVCPMSILCSCYALPGDTIVWGADQDGLGVRGYQPASQEELEDRGYVGEGRRGVLSQICHRARVDLSDDDED